MNNDATKELVYSKFEWYADVRAIANDCVSLSCQLLLTLQHLFIRDDKYRENVIECSNLLENLSLILRKEANGMIDKEAERILGDKNKETNNG